MRNKREYRPRFPRPKKMRAPDPVAGHVARIDELSGLSRGNWFSHMAYVAFVSITLVSVHHADFFLPSRQTRLPVVGVSIPTEQFFAAAPLIGAALYVYLHIHLSKLWEALAQARLAVGGDAVADRVQSWLVNDLVLNIPGPGRATPKPLTRISNFATKILVWWAGPLVLLAFWTRSMPAHDEVLTLWIGFCAMVAIYAGSVSWWKLRAMLDGAAPTDPLWTWPRRLAALAIFVGIVSISWLRTEGGWREYDHPSWAITLPDEERFAVTSGGFARSGLFPSVDLAGFDFVQLPGNWRDHRTARRNFRRSWCGALGIPSGPCYRMEPDASKVPQEIWQLRAQVCEARGRGTDCSAYFAELDQQFHADWVQERRASLASLNRNDFGKEDFRRAKFPNTTMPNADLYSTRLEGANFFRAYLEGVNFQLATLHDTFFANADLSLARFRYTWISDTTFREADLSEASFHYALLVSTSKEKIDFTDAILSATDFRGAALKNVNMSAAQIDSLTDLSMSFGDSTVSLPDGVTRPCQWSDEDLPVEEFLGRWRWWVSHADNEWNRYAEARWDHLPLIEPPQDDPIRACTWEKSVTRWSE